MAHVAKYLFDHTHLIKNCLGSRISDFNLGRLMRILELKDLN